MYVNELSTRLAKVAIKNIFTTKAMRWDKTRNINKFKANIWEEIITILDNMLQAAMQNLHDI